MTPDETWQHETITIPPRGFTWGIAYLLTKYYGPFKAFRLMWKGCTLDAGPTREDGRQEVHIREEGE
jgi:hypothetical protein